MEMEDEVEDYMGEDGQYSGTFRWKRTKKLKSMPPPKLPLSNEPLPYKGWKTYLMERVPVDSFLRSVQEDMSIIDCLSSPLSICHICDRLKLLDRSVVYESITIICIGCSSKAEERILKETNCWQEMRLYFRNVVKLDLWLVGPEISCTKEDCTVDNSTSFCSSTGQLFSSHLFQGTSVEFFRAYPKYLNRSKNPNIVVGLNCGFGNYENPLARRYNLLLQWLSDLYFLSGTNLPVVFTCANDYADLVGEVSVMNKILGSYFVCLPAENPFSFASTMVPPAAEGVSVEEAYARGNSFYYAIQGSDKARRTKLADLLGSTGNSTSANTPAVQNIMQLIGDCVVDVNQLPTRLVQCALTVHVVGKEGMTRAAPAPATATALAPPSASATSTKTTHLSTEKKQIDTEKSSISSGSLSRTAPLNQTRSIGTTNGPPSSSSTTSSFPTSSLSPSSSSSSPSLSSSSTLASPEKTENVPDDLMQSSSWSDSPLPLLSVEQSVSLNRLSARLASLADTYLQEGKGKGNRLGVLQSFCLRNDLQVSISTEGDLLLVDAMLDTETRTMDVSCAFQKTYHIPLIHHVNPDSMQAKYSKKTKTVTITAECTI